MYLPLQPGVLRRQSNAKTVTLCELKNDHFVLSGLPEPRQSHASGQWTASATGLAQSLPTSQGVVEWQNCRGSERAWTRCSVLAAPAQEPARASGLEPRSVVLAEYVQRTAAQWARCWSTAGRRWTP